MHSIQKILIKTLGCPKNEVDSRKLIHRLIQHGYEITKNEEDAEFIIINTCSFIHDAREESINTIFETIQYKEQQNRSLKIGVIGCLPALYENELKKEIPEIDFFWKADSFAHAADNIKKKFPVAQTISNSKSKSESRRSFAYLRTSRGCSRKCAFCSIPAIRGSFTEFSIEQVKQQLHEIQSSSKLPTEIVLVAQDTVSSNIEEYKKILDYLSGFDQIKWIRIMYLFPDKRIFSFLNLWKDYPKLVSYMDIPFQHISSRILKKMNRLGDKIFFNEILRHAEAIRSNAEIRTTFLIGSPEETPSDVEEILQFISHKDSSRIQKLSLFEYSHEEHTSAYSLYPDFKKSTHTIDAINNIRDTHLETRSSYRSSLIDKTEKMIVDRVKKDEVIVRREQDAPEIDESVFIDNPKMNAQNLTAGELIPVRLSMQMEYDWIGEFADV